MASKNVTVEGDNPTIEVSTVYGVVTDGALWQFLSLKDNIAIIDSYLYHFGNGSQIVGILKSFLRVGK